MWTCETCGRARDCRIRDISESVVNIGEGPIPPFGCTWHRMGPVEFEAEGRASDIGEWVSVVHLITEHPPEIGVGQRYHVTMTPVE